VKGFGVILKVAGRKEHMLKVAIVGCGKIADDHVEQIRRIKDCEIVGVCDREPLMARQLYIRSGARQYFYSLDSLLNEAKPDVVHITTPPQSHFGIAKTCLEAGCHVYVEKPFTLYEHEARELLALANAKGLKVTAGHDDQFRHSARLMRTLIQSGYLGGAPVHMESYFCYELGRGGFAGALLNDKNYWVRKLPGGLLHNIISHGIARIAEYFTSENPFVIAHGFISPFLQSRGETELVDELRVIISEEQGTTAYFTFSSQMRPSLHQFRAYGSKNGLVLDQDEETLIKLQGHRYTSYVEKFIPPFSMAKQDISNGITNIRRFLKRDFHMKSGMKYLIESFYASIIKDAPVPIPYREIILTAHIMDRIFGQLQANAEPAPCLLETTVR
jgi:predicted dehydrogenase